MIGCEDLFGCRLADRSVWNLSWCVDLQDKMIGLPKRDLSGMFDRVSSARIVYSKINYVNISVRDLEIVIVLRLCISLQDDLEICKKIQNSLNTLTLKISWSDEKTGQS